MPLRQQQIEAVCALRQKHLPKWCAAALALDELGQAFPGWGLKECYLKVAAVNALYATNVSSIAKWTSPESMLTASPDSCGVFLCLTMYWFSVNWAHAQFS